MGIADCFYLFRPLAVDACFRVSLHHIEKLRRKANLVQDPEKEHKNRIHLTKPPKPPRRHGSHGQDLLIIMC
jgi:hypothetical protein